MLGILDTIDIAIEQTDGFTLMKRLERFYSNDHDKVVLSCFFKSPFLDEF